MRYTSIVSNILEHHDGRDYWLRTAGRLRRRVFAGWWWTFAAKPLVLGSVLAALGVAAVRYYDGPWAPAWLLVAAVPPVSALAGFVRARRRRLSWTDALSRLDVAYGLHHRLVTAHTLDAPWPPPPADDAPAPRLPVHWRPAGIWPPPLLVLLMLGSAAWLPIRAVEPETPVVRQALRDWERIETVVEQLRAEAVVREEALRRIEEPLDALRRKPSEEWYRQGSLEATEHLRDHLDRHVQELHRHLEQAAAMVDTAATRRDTLTRETLARMQQGFEELLTALEHGALALDEDLLQRLKEIDISDLGEISLAELRELELSLGEACDAAGQCAALLAVAGTVPGAGGPMDTPDGATSPLTLADQETRLEQAVPEAVSNPDLQRAALGELLGVREGAHDVEPAAYAGPSAAGEAATPGGAGEVVWRQSILPSEQSVLRAYFQ